MKTIKLFLALVGVCFLCSCSVFMAATQPDKKELAILKPGVHQFVIRSEFGVPVWQGEEDGAPVDLFKFKQGYSKWTKAGRALFHGTADLFTFGIWEIVGTPIEVFESGKDATVKVYYDRELKAHRMVIQVGTDENVIAASEPERTHVPVF
jgi:hypothetical protein